MALSKKPVTGMKDILPAEMEIRDYCIGIIKDTYAKFGFTSIETPSTSVKVSLSDITINQPQKLVFVLPTGVSDGLWDVTVTTQLGSGSKPIKTVRSSSLPDPLQVGEPEEDDDEQDGPVVQ